MSVKSAVLGLLSERRGYGYELAQRLTERLGPAWQLKPSGVYWALDRLERSGHVQRDEQDDPAPPSAGRVRYSITAPGREAFEQWLAQPSTGAEPIRHPLQLKVAVARPEDAPTIVALAAHEERLIRRLQHVCTAPPTEHAVALVHAGILARLDAELYWLEQVRAAHAGS
jgi:DNA-binding PadR family transcriptional regulator